MNKIEVKIEVLSYSKNQADSYILILSELNSNRKIPIVIKANDAQFISIKMENIRTYRPMTQDLIRSITDAYNLDIQEVMIYSFSEGIFYTRLVTTNMVDSIDIECTIGDALSMSALYKCPIYVTEEVMLATSIDADAPPKVIKTKKEPPKKRKEVDSLQSLDKMLQQALELEDYELAVELRDRIFKLKKV